MAETFDSIFQNVVCMSSIDSQTRAIAAMCIKRYFKDLLASHEIDIADEDVEELAYDIVDELCTTECNYLN